MAFFAISSVKMATSGLSPLSGAYTVFKTRSSYLPGSNPCVLRSDCVSKTILISYSVYQGPYPHVDPAALPLLHELATSTFDSWDQHPELSSTPQEKLWTVFGNVLNNCAVIRTILETEALDERQYPKESFLVVLLRNVFLRVNEELASR